MIPMLYLKDNKSDVYRFYQEQTCRDRFSHTCNSSFYICNTETTIYNPQIQISAESGTKRSIFRQKNKTKRSKKRLHTTLIKPEQKVNEDLCSGFIVS